MKNKLNVLSRVGVVVLTLIGSVIHSLMQSETTLAQTPIPGFGWPWPGGPPGPACPGCEPDPQNLLELDLHLPEGATFQLDVDELGANAQEFLRDQPLRVELNGFEPGVTLTLVLLRYDAAQKVLVPFSSRQVQTDADGNLQEEGVIPTYAPSGQYFMVACGLSDCSAQSIKENLGNPQVFGQSFELPNRLEGLDLDLVTGATTYLDAEWTFEHTEEDQIELKWYRNGEEFIPPRSTNSWNQQFELLRFLDPNWQGTELYAPTVWNLFAPGINRLYPNLDYPSLAPGEYRLEVYVNTALEASEEIEVQQ